MVADSAKSEAPKNVSTSATSLQPPVSGPPTHPGSFMHRSGHHLRLLLFQEKWHQMLIFLIMETTCCRRRISATSSNPNTASPPPFRMPPGPPFQPPPGAPRTPVTPQQPFYGSYASNSPMARSLHQSETCLDRNFYHIHLRFLCQLNARHCRWSNHPMLSLLVHQLEFRAAWLKEKCAGTDWSLVTTNDGKRYYYNAKTKQLANTSRCGRVKKEAGK
ncbi:putative WW domain-containing protein [Helianthus annuus]|nr:putative WW domain-containing protein [Helianthus annuus]